jgi:AcrR family transcriptional regulator
LWKKDIPSLNLLSGFSAQIGFDANTTLKIADGADVMVSLIYHRFKRKRELFKNGLDLAYNEYISRLVELLKHTHTELQQIASIIYLHFQTVVDLPEQMLMIVTTCPAKLNDPNGMCLKCCCAQSM